LIYEGVILLKAVLPYFFCYERLQIFSALFFQQN